ncbi:MAG: YfhO family protein, partial [Oscillospiraceae bacterium]
MKKKIFSDDKKWLILAVILTSLVIYSSFIFGNNLFMYKDANDDTFQSYLPAYQMMVQMLSEGNFSLMNLTCGLGSSLLSMQFVLFDPFALPVYIVGLVFGIGSMAGSLVYAHILRSICAALACRYFLGSFKIGAVERDIAAWCYAFSSFMIGGIGQHYMFATAPVFIAVILGLIERSRKKRILLFPLAFIVMMSAIWSVYFSYMILLASGIYAVVRYLQQDEPISIGDALSKLLPLLCSVVCGLTLSGVVLIPTVSLMLTTSDRIVMGDSLLSKLQHSFELLDLPNLKSIALRFFSDQMQGSMNKWRGNGTSFNSAHLFIGMLLPLAITQYGVSLIARKKSRTKYVTIGFIILAILSCVTGFAGNVFNMFVSYFERYTFVLLPAFAYIMAWMLHEVFHNRQFNKIIGWITTIACIGLIYTGCAWDEYAAAICAVEAIVSILVCCIIFTLVTVTKKERAVIYQLSICGVLFVGFSVESTTTLTADRILVKKDAYSQATAYDKAVSGAVEQLGMKDDRFLRMERNTTSWIQQPAFTYSEALKYRSVSFYNSLLQSGINRFRTDFIGENDKSGIIISSYYMNGMGIAFDDVYADLLGIKYVVSTYATENKNWELNGNISESNIYSNKDLESAGVLYSSWIDTNKFEELSLLERQAMLSQTVLIEGNVPGAVETGNVQPPRKNQEAIDMKSLKTANGTIVENDHFNFRIEAQEDGSASMTFSLNAKAVNEEYQQNWLVLDAKSMQNCSLQILCDTGFGFDATYWAQTTKPL